LHGFIIKDDDRYEYTQRYLETCGVKFLNKINKKSDLNFILFPFRSEINSQVYNKNFFAALNKKIFIFSGIENKYIKFMCEKNKLYYEPIMNSDYVSVLNSVPTAEGVLAYLISNRKKIIMNSRILIIGYGRCGKVLSQKLFALGANVFVNTLVQSDYAHALINKIIPVYNFDFKHEYFDVIINTAPCETITQENLKEISCESLLLDITAHGFDLNLAQKKNEKSNRLLSIPSRFALQTAGEILGRFIYERLSKC